MKRLSDSRLVEFSRIDFFFELFLQKPSEADLLMISQKDADETVKILVNLRVIDWIFYNTVRQLQAETVKKIEERQVDVEDLLDKSTRLTEQSEEFFKTV